MSAELAMLWASFLLAAATAVLVHEAAHAAVARVYRYPAVCWGISPVAVGIVFLDRPRKGYLLLQVAAPLATTTLVLYLGFFVLSPASRVALQLSSLWLHTPLALCATLSLLTSSADLMCAVSDLRRPADGRERLLRNSALLCRSSSLLRFTPFGRHYLERELGLSPEGFTRTAAGADWQRLALLPGGDESRSAPGPVIVRRPCGYVGSSAVQWGEPQHAAKCNRV